MAIFLMLLISLFYTALGTAIASTMRDFHGFQLIMNFLVMPTFFLSGALFPLDQTPAFIRTLSSFNPLTYGVDGLRSTLVGVSHFGLGVDILVLSFVSLTALMIGSYLFSRITV